MALEPGDWKIGMATGVLVIEQRAQAILRGIDLHPRDILETGDHAVSRALDDDLAELVRVGQPTLRVDRKLKLNALVVGRSTNDARGGLHVLTAHGVDHVIGGEADFGDLFRVKPDPHGVIAGAKKPDIADAVDLRELILDVQHGVIAQVKHVAAVVGGREVDDHGQVGRGLYGGHANLLRD